ncbi:hypothetical protein [Arsenicicoccus dermatophilus]|uniref:hypothetical protein n=1 Tax=Arsenicicoccus dermatophilus TaxID=1076331 RepID=UPI003916D6A6
MNHRILTRTAVALGAATLALGVAPAQAAPAAPAAHDLAVSYHSSLLKAPGAAGTASIDVTNVGSERYFQEYPLTTFVVKVSTVSGPRGVDRVITPRTFNGAHVRDLGFDPATSTRSFEISLSNPVATGQRVHVADLSFADGLTREGRLVQHLVTTQTGRLADDRVNANDQAVDSVGHTVSGVGTSLPGLF